MAERRRDAVASRTPQLRIGEDRVRLYGVGLFLIGLTQLHAVSSEGHFWDWLDFQIAGLTVGTRALLDPAARAAWGVSHGVPTTAFAYMPGYAWVLFAPARLPLAWGFAFNAVAMFVVCCGAALVAARIYDVSRWFAMLAILAWAPTTAAILTGQNSPIGLLLWLGATAALSMNRRILAGVFLGLLLYKPTYAVPLGLLLLFRRDWIALGTTAGCGLVWYVASAAAAANDWLWPIAYLRSVGEYVGPDFAYNAPKAVSLPGLLMRVGVGNTTAFLVGMVILIIAAWRASRRPLVEATSMIALVGVITSPHAWPYDAVLALPALLWVATTVTEPWRTRFLAFAYAIAPLWLFSHVLRGDPLALPLMAAVGVLVWRAELTDGGTNSNRE